MQEYREGTGSPRPEVTLIVPVYNNEASLVKMLESVKKQTFTDFTAIFVDDGSEDRSREILKCYVDTDPRYRLLTGENSGVAAARNRALELVDTPWVMWADGDDYLEPDFIRRLYEAVTDRPEYGMAVCGVYRENEAGSPLSDYPAVPMDTAVSAGTMLEWMLDTRKCRSWLWNKIFRASLLAGYRFDPMIRVNSDVEFMIRFLSQTDCMCRFIPDRLYHYVIRKNTLSHGNAGKAESFERIRNGTLAGIRPSEAVFRRRMLYVISEAESLLEADHPEKKKRLKELRLYVRKHPEELKVCSPRVRLLCMILGIHESLLKPVDKLLKK